ncbi:TIGR02679 family protein [Tsukamurella soli]|uniref:TIGR02679 family protein n=1 Tax=Tsukamurella soli TaxID=644556 RepID=UPI0031E739FC
MSPPSERLVRVLGGADTERLRDRLRERMARGLILTGSISLVEPTEQERAAIDRLLGRRPGAGRTVSAPLGTLDRVLRESGIWPEGLASAVVALTGPVPVRSELRSAADAAWATALAPLRPLVTERPELSDWHRELTGGLVRRLADGPDGAATLVGQVCAVVRALPSPPIPLGEFATAVLGSAHALDDGMPTATLSFGAARAIGGAPAGSGARWRRQVWESVGLVRDQLTSTVLAVGLRAHPTTVTGRSVELLSGIGQPVVLTLRQLRTEAVTWSVGGMTVSVCENPSVVAAAADRLGAECRPLVCTSGQPGAAVLLLLDQLVAAGASLRYHGDFDWYGLRIADFVRRHHDWQPWRFTAADYRAAARMHDGAALIGSPSVASWDPELTAVMASVGIQVEEEAVLADLLVDLT